MANKGIAAMRAIDAEKRAEAAQKAAQTRRNRNAAERAERDELARDREQALTIARAIRDHAERDADRLEAIRLIAQLTAPHDNPPPQMVVIRKWDDFSFAD